MKRICAWCKLDMGKEEPLDDPSITHGICPKCMKALKNEAKDFFKKTEEKGATGNDLE